MRAPGTQTRGVRGVLHHPRHLGRRGIVVVLRCVGRVLPAESSAKAFHEAGLCRNLILDLFFPWPVAEPAQAVVILPGAAVAQSLRYLIAIELHPGGAHLPAPPPMVNNIALEEEVITPAVVFSDESVRWAAEDGLDLSQR